MTHCMLMLGNDLSQAVAPNPTTYEDLSYDVSKQFNFPPLFTITGFKNLSFIVFHFIKKVFDACGFSVITSSL